MRRTKGEREELSSGRGEFGFFKNRGGEEKKKGEKLKRVLILGSFINSSYVKVSNLFGKRNISGNIVSSGWNFKERTAMERVKSRSHLFL